MGAEIQLEGFEDLAKKLREMPKAMKMRVLRNALAAGARVVRSEAQRLVPVLSLASKAAHRRPGTVKRAIRVRTSKAARRDGDVGVFVNVKPAPGVKFKTQKHQVLGLRYKTRLKVKASQRGAQSPNDPYYWRFLEFGTRKMSAKSFLQPAAEKLPEALRVFNTQVSRWIEKVDRNGSTQS